MDQEASIAALLALIHERHSFLITSHAGPDGDAIGTALGLMHMLHALGKQATVVFADPVPAICRTLPGVDGIVTTLPYEPADALIVLECDSYERTGFTRAQFEAVNPGMSINIDHHLSGRNYAGFNWIDPEAAAVGQMVYDLVLAFGIGITPDAATCLYTAVLTDSGAFTYPLTTAHTLALAAHLVDCGADPNRIAQDVLFSTPPGRARLLGFALSHFQIDGPICWSVLTLGDMQMAGATAEDSEGIVNHLIGMAGIHAAVLVRELPEPGTCRLSLRSKGSVDVSTVAKTCGGGGHRNASGCTLQGTLESALATVLPALHAAALQQDVHAHVLV